MCIIGKGTYLHGAPEGSVETETFFIDRFEVSNNRYLRYVDTLDAAQKATAIPTCTTGHSPWRDATGWVHSDIDLPANFGRHPVACVSLNQAKDFCQWAQKRIPSKIDWQIAGMASNWQAYPWGNNWPERGTSEIFGEAVANCQNSTASCLENCCNDHSGFGNCGINDPCINTLPETADDGTALMTGGKSSFEIMQMSGNVAEWVLDDDDKAYTCGGSWDDIGPDLELWDCDLRVNPDSTKLSTIGFRCAWSAE